MTKAETCLEPATADKKSPAESGVWMFILGDMMLFALLFASYAWDRTQQYELFVQSQAALSKGFGVVNTLLLLTGSLFVVLGLHWARGGAIVRVQTCLILAIVTGVAFFVNKIIEYREKVSEGYTLITNDFFMYYYMLTGLHLLHVMVGIGVLIFLWVRSRQAAYSHCDIRNMESGGAVWHMVDLLWIALFPLLYLIK
jgi:nitric oxide reductase NorE protein